MQIGSGINSQNLNYLNRNENATKEVLSKIAATRELSGKDGADFINADALSSQISSLTRNIQNENESLSMYQIADGAVLNLSQNGDRLNQLSVAYNNASLNDSQKYSLEREFNATLQSMNDIISQTSYNGKQLFNSDFGLNIEGLDGVSIDNQDSIESLIDSIASVSSDISSSTNKSLVTIANSLSALSNATASYSSISETSADSKISDLNGGKLKLDSSILAQNHQTDLLKRRMSDLLV